MAVGSEVGAHSPRPAVRIDFVETPPQHVHARRSKRRWVSAVATGLVMAIAAVVVGAAVLVYVFHPRFDTVLTGSMRPGIQPGDVVMVRAVPTDELKVGDVIAYLPPAHTTPVLHRIVSIDSSGLVTKGDANNVADPWGKVGTDSATTLRLVWVIPKVGLIAHDRSTIYLGAGALLIAAVALTVLTHKRSGNGDDGGNSPYDDSLREGDTGPSNEKANSISIGTTLTSTTER